MRHIQTLFLYVGLALAGLALTASTATAQETEVEVAGEHTGAACDACEIHLVGESHMTDTATGVIVSTCEDEFMGTIDHDGTGTLQWNGGAAHGAPGCNLANCQTGDEPQWPLTDIGELSNGNAHITARLCLRSPVTGTELHCDAELGIGELGTPHDYELSASPLCASGARRIEGLWEIETPQPAEIELNHSGEGPVDVVAEPTGVSCDPCAIHLVGESHMTDTFTGVIVSTCEDEFTGTIDHDGTGTLEWNGGAAHGAPGCNLVNCQTGDEPQWPLTDIGELSNGNAHITARLCLRSPLTGAELHCDVEMTVEPDATHHYVFATSQLCAGERRIEGLWESEAVQPPDEIELNHAVDPPSEVEVVDESGGAPCDPCEIHISGESHMFDNINMVIIMTCEDELIGSINHDGTGSVEWIGNAHGSPGCNVVNCLSGDEPVWPLGGLTELSGGEEHVIMRFCYRNPLSGAELHCDGEVGLSDESPGSHHHTYEMVALCAGGARRVEGVWVDEAPSVEYVHAS